MEWCGLLAASLLDLLGCFVGLMCGRFCVHCCWLLCCLMWLVAICAICCPSSCWLLVASLLPRATLCVAGLCIECEILLFLHITIVSLLVFAFCLYPSLLAT